MSLHDLSKVSFADRMRAFRAQQRGEAPVAPVPVEAPVGKYQGPQRPRTVRDLDNNPWRVPQSNVLALLTALRAGTTPREEGVYACKPSKISARPVARLLLLTISDSIAPMLHPYLPADSFHADYTSPGRVALFRITSGELIDLTRLPMCFAYYAQSHSDRLSRGARPHPQDVTKCADARIVHTEGRHVHYLISPYGDSEPLPAVAFAML